MSEVIGYGFVIAVVVAAIGLATQCEDKNRKECEARRCGSGMHREYIHAYKSKSHCLCVGDE